MNFFKSMFLRRRFLVDIPFQRSLIWRTVSLSCFLLAAVLFGLLLPVLRERNAPGTDLSFTEDAATAFLHLHANLWWIVALCVVLPIMVALHASHRIAGPLVRIKRMLQQLGHGTLPPPLETRRRDYLKPEVALLNAVVGRLGERLEGMRAVHQDLARALASAKHCTGGEHSLARASAAAAELGGALETFLGPDPLPPASRLEAAPPPTRPAKAPVG